MLDFKKCVWGARAALALWVFTLGATAPARAQAPWTPIPAPTAPRMSVPVADMPPAVPEHAKSVRSMTLEVSVRYERAGASPSLQRHTVTRTASRVHVQQAEGREWLYLQNPRDPARVSGWLVDHAEKVIVRYDESELRNWQGVRGWLDVLTLGVDLRAVTGPSVALAIRDVEGLTFVRHDQPRPDQEPDQIWWCQDQLLPHEVVRHLPQGSTGVSIERIRFAVATELLDPPEVRFPSYQTTDLAEWLEHR
jgi:hypothetical protein